MYLEVLELSCLPVIMQCLYCFSSVLSNRMNLDYTNILSNTFSKIVNPITIFFFRRFRNLVATLTAYDFQTKHDIRT